jgi:inhibitor of KinA
MKTLKKKDLKLRYNHTYKPFGDSAILIEWSSEIDESILQDILLFKNKISSQKSIPYSDLIIGYNSLTIKYTDVFLDFFIEIDKLKSIYKLDFSFKKEERFLWEIPVCYHLDFGIDLKEISKKKNLTIEEIIKLHSEKRYTVFFIGFLPGFLYLGGLDSKLFYDRKPNPRLKVSKGAVAIGGKQTGVYPTSSAGGWNIIGRTPITFFDIEKSNPCFAKAGDKIIFKPISLDKFHQIEKDIHENKYIITKTLLHD